MEGRILQFIFIFMTVSADVCPKFPELLWDVEQDDKSFYFSSWQRDSVKNPKQNRKQPNPKKNQIQKKKPPKKKQKNKPPNPLPCTSVLQSVGVWRNRRGPIGWNLNVWQGMGKMSWLLVAASQWVSEWPCPVFFRVTFFLDICKIRTVHQLHVFIEQRDYFAASLANGANQHWKGIVQEYF